MEMRRPRGPASPMVFLSGPIGYLALGSRGTRFGAHRTIVRGFRDSRRVRGERKDARIRHDAGIAPTFHDPRRCYAAGTRRGKRFGLRHSGSGGMAASSIVDFGGEILSAYPAPDARKRQAPDRHQPSTPRHAGHRHTAALRQIEGFGASGFGSSGRGPGSRSFTARQGRVLLDADDTSAIARASM